MYCIPKFAAETFKQKIVSGEINPEKLSAMTSEERHSFFSEFLGEEHGAKTNALFESKLLLKNQQQGIISWAQKVSGLSSEARRDIISRVQRLDKVLNPSEEKKFLSDLAEQKLGVGVSPEEAQKISSLAQATEESRLNIPEDAPLGSLERLDYGAHKVAFDNYLNALKEDASKATLADIKSNPVGSVVHYASEIAGIAKSLKASLDDSFIGRQGLKALFNHPVEWAKSAATSVEIIAKQLGKKASSNEVVDAIKAEIYSRPNALNGFYKKMGLDIGLAEEAFPTSLPEKVPLLGRVFKASEAAFTGTAYRLRADIADKLTAIAEGEGIDVTEKGQLESIGKLVNSLTGRGALGRAEGFSKVINNLFFSPKFFKSNIDYLTLHAFDKNFSGFARKQAAYNLMRGVAGVAGILAIANAVHPGSVELDPTSADFGKIKIGNTRFDVTGGVGSIATLAARLITQKSKSSSTGRVTTIDSGKYGAPTTLSVLGDFFTNKLAPVPTTVVALRAGKDRNNNVVDTKSQEGLTNLAKSLFEPLPISNYEELKNNPHSADTVAAMIADGLGISTNTYGK